MNVCTIYIESIFGKFKNKKCIEHNDNPGFYCGILILPCAWYQTLGARGNIWGVMKGNCVGHIVSFPEVLKKYTYTKLSKVYGYLPLTVYAERIHSASLLTHFVTLQPYFKMD